MHKISKTKGEKGMNINKTTGAQTPCGCTHTHTHTHRGFKN